MWDVGRQVRRVREGRGELGVGDTKLRELVVRLRGCV